MGFSQAGIYQPVVSSKPTTLAQYKARSVARVDWAEKKLKQLGRVGAVLYFNKFDVAAPVNDYVFVFVCDDGKNESFVLANKKRSIVFTDLFNNPNHIKLRKAVKMQPSGAWTKYPNPITGHEKYAYVRLLKQYKYCVGSGFSM